MAKLRIITYLMVALCVTLAFISCREDVVTQEQVLATLDSLEHKFEWLNYRTAEETWDLYTTGISDSLEFYRGLYEYVVSDPQTFRILDQGNRLVTDENDQRRLELIHGAFLASQVESSPKVNELRDSLTLVDIHYRADFEGQPRTQGELYHIYRTDKDRSRRERAFRAYCFAGDNLADGLSQLIRLRNQETHKLGYNNFFTLTFLQEKFNQKEYVQLLHRLDSLSLRPYQEILSDVEKRTGLHQIELWDLAYAYVESNREVDRYFPVDSQLVYIKRSLRKLGFDLDKLPIYFDLESREGKSQLAYAFPIKVPNDIRVLGNLTNGLYSSQVLLHETGHALHFAHVAQEQSLYANSGDAAWTEGMAQLIAALCDEDEWLMTYAHLPLNLVESYQQTKHKQDLIYLRTTLTRLMFEYEAYQNPNRDLNSLYWDLFERYVMLPRHDDLKPWAGIIHYTTHPVYLHNYLMADIIAAQSLAKLKKTYDSIVNEPSVGSFLVQNYFRFGDRYDWRDLLERGTDETLNSEYLIQRLGI